jgi:hypothetical protein
MKKLIATLALLSCVFSVNAASCETFRVSPCSAQVVTIATNSLNPKQLATSVYITKDYCGKKMATVSLVPTAYNPCATPCAVPACVPEPVVIETCAPCNPCAM